MSNYNQHLARHIGHNLEIMDWAGNAVVIYCRECTVPIVDECRGKCRDTEFLEHAIERKFVELSGLVEKVLVTKSRVSNGRN